MQACQGNGGQPAGMRWEGDSAEVGSVRSLGGRGWMSKVQPGESSQRGARKDPEKDLVPASGAGDRWSWEPLLLSRHTLQMPLMQRSRLAWPW